MFKTPEETRSDVISSQSRFLHRLRPKRRTVREREKIRAGNRDDSTSRVTVSGSATLWFAYIYSRWQMVATSSHITIKLTTPPDAAPRILPGLINKSGVGFLIRFALIADPGSAGARKSLPVRRVPLVIYAVPAEGWASPAVKGRLPWLRVVPPYCLPVRLGFHCTVFQPAPYLICNVWSDSADINNLTQRGASGTDFSKIVSIPEMRRFYTPVAFTARILLGVIKANRTSSEESAECFIALFLEA